MPCFHTNNVAISAASLYRFILLKIIQTVFYCCFIAVVLMHFNAHAETAAPTEKNAIRQYDIPAGPLSTVLTRFISEAGILFAGSTEQAKNRYSPGVRGTFSVQAALSVLLTGTGLEAKRNAQGQYVLQSAASAIGTLPLMTVTGAAINPEVTEGTGSYTTGAMNTATPLSLSIRETPQSVSVLTTQQIEDQHLITLDDTAQNVPGLTMQKGSYIGASGAFYARGFPISKLMLDGLPTGLGGNGTFNADNEDLAIYDRVEVVRGSTGLTNGSGSPSAAINLVRKRPSAVPKISIISSIGRWDDYRILIDAGGALNSNKSIRGRTVMSIQDKDNFYDYVNDRTQQVYGILEFDLTPTTLLTAGAHWRTIDSDGMYSRQPANENGSFLNIPRSANFGNDFDYWKQQTITAFTELKHQFANDWSVKLSAIHRWQDADLLFSEFDRINGTLYQLTQSYVLDLQQTSLNLNANGPLSLLGRTHELAMGISYQRSRYDAYGGWPDYSWTTNAPVVDPFSKWNPHLVPKPDINMNEWVLDFTAKELGTYAVARINLADPLKLIIGSRVDWHERIDYGRNLQYKPNPEVIPYGGLIYDLNSNHSAYVGWTRIYQPPTAFFGNAVSNKNGNPLVPVNGTNLEAGIKGEYFDGRLNASVAIFQIKQQNRPVDDTTGPNPCPGIPSGFCKRPAGEVKSEGVEFEVSGELVPGWQLHSGYTYVSSKYTKDQNPTNIGKPSDPVYPKHLFKLATNYQLPGQLNRWRMGGNLHYQNSTSNYNERVKQDGYVLVGFNLGYKFNKHLNAQLNINNIFDKHYYIQGGQRGEIVQGCQGVIF